MHIFYIAIVMEWVLFALFTFLLGLYVCLNYSSAVMTEGFRPRCPNVLIQNGNEIWLKNTNLADVPGVNPIIFHSLDEYTEFVSWQKSQGIKCPLLYLQKKYDPQNEIVYEQRDPILLLDASRNDPPYNQNSYPGIDPQNQNIGDVTMLDKYHDIGETQTSSKNAMDPNWDGS